MENNFAFIDSQNVNLQVQALGWKLDFGKFRRYLKDKYRVTKAYLFIGYIKSNQHLYTYLERAGYELVFKPVVLSEAGPKGNVDAELVLQAMHELCDGNFDKAVIATGDGDFHCLVKYLHEYKKLKAIVSPRRRSTSKLLTDDFSPYIQFLNRETKKLARK